MDYFPRLSPKNEIKNEIILGPFNSWISYSSLLVCLIYQVLILSYILDKHILLWRLHCDDYDSIAFVHITNFLLSHSFFPFNIWSKHEHASCTTRLYSKNISKEIWKSYCYDLVYESDKALNSKLWAPNCFWNLAWHQKCIELWPVIVSLEKVVFHSLSPPSFFQSDRRFKLSTLRSKRTGNSAPINVSNVSIKPTLAI